MDVYDGTMAAVEAARTAGVVTDMDEGAVEALLQLAARLDDPDYPNIDGRFDNVTAALYFKACEQLGLTPSGRSRLAEKKETGGGKLAQLRAVQGGQTGRKRTG